MIIFIKLKIICTNSFFLLQIYIYDYTISLFFFLNKKIKKRGEGEKNTLPNYEKKKKWSFKRMNEG